MALSLGRVELNHRARRLDCDFERAPETAVARSGSAAEQRRSALHGLTIVKLSFCGLDVSPDAVALALTV
jgi:hypothetical protein